MSATPTRPVARLAALATGVLAIVLGAVTAAGPTVPDEHWGNRGAIVNGLGLVTFLAMAVATEGLPALLRLRRAGMIAVRTAQAGLAMMVLESAASQVHGGNTLGPVFMLGLLLALVGFLAAGIDGLRRPGARWIAPLPFLAMLVGIAAGDRGGFVVLGAVWAGLALGGHAADRSAQPA
jgi:hypothetical protein